MIWSKEETLPREEIEKIQLERLQETVARVYANVEPYRKKMDDAGVKPEDIQSLDDLKKLNLSSDDLAKISRGELPDGYQVHHKLSLDDGGDNSSANLILIRDTDHEIFTYYQNTFTRTNDFKAKGYAEVDWVVPTGQVYVPTQPADVYIKWTE